MDLYSNSRVEVKPLQLILFLFIKYQSNIQKDPKICSQYIAVPRALSLLVFPLPTPIKEELLITFQESIPFHICQIPHASPSYVHLEDRAHPAEKRPALSTDPDGK